LLSGGLTIFGILALVYCRLSRRGTAIFLYGKDILNATGNPIGRPLLLLSQLLADVVVTNSRYTASLLAGFARLKAQVLYPSVEPNIGAKVLSAEPRERSILFVGRLIKRKGVDDLIDAFRIIANSDPNLRLDIVGDGPERKPLEQLAADLTLGSRVTFFGTLKGQALFDKYRQCAVFVMPSKSLDQDVEGFGTVFLEAGLFAKPAVGTRSGGIPEAVLDGITGILVDEADASELARGLQSILTDKGLARTLGEKARKRVLEEFTWEKGADGLVSILKLTKHR